MSLLRAPLTLISTYGISYACTPPNPPIKDEERKAYSGAELKLLPLLWPLSLKTLSWFHGLCETAVIVAHNFPHPPLTDNIIVTLMGRARNAAFIQINPTFLVGTLSTSLGAYIRHRCYRTLGRFFTYELSIRKEHQLVTSGPYSVVRHPSYSGSFLAIVGIHLCMLGPGSLLQVSELLQTKAGEVLRGVMVVNVFAICIWMARRTIIEDRTLKQQFGEQWDRWARRVPYRMIPYVF